MTFTESDTMRMDWLEAHPSFCAEQDESGWCYWFEEGTQSWGGFQTLRQAIDNAIRWTL